MPSVKNVCINFKKVLWEDYEERDQDIIRSLMIYISFLMQHSPADYGKFAPWQVADMCMSTYNPKVDITKTALETLWRYSRRGGKSQKLTALSVFGSLMDLKMVWRATYADQLGQASEWFNMNPFVSDNKITSSNTVRVFGSPDINISVLSEAKVASRGADWLIYDEGGWCFKNHKKHEYYVASRPMLAASQTKRITHASTPAKMTSFHDASINLEKTEAKLNTKLTSWHPWGDCPWISKEWVEQERQLHSDCAWYVDQNYEALWVIYGGAVFNNVILEGDPSYPAYPLGFLQAMKETQGIDFWGVDFNGEDTQHFRIGIKYDINNVYVLEETRFLDLWQLDGLLGSLELEDGMYNNKYTAQTKRMGINARYKQWNEDSKHLRVGALQERNIIINKTTCPITYKNLLEAALDKNSRLPKLEKRSDQHGLDGLLHAMHVGGGTVSFPKRKVTDYIRRTNRLENL